MNFDTGRSYWLGIFIGFLATCVSFASDGLGAFVVICTLLFLGSVVADYFFGRTD